MLRRDALPRMGMRRCKRRAVIDSERWLVVELSGSSPKFILPQARSAAQCRSGVTSFQWWHYISGVSSRRSIGAEVNSVRVPFEDLPSAVRILARHAASGQVQHGHVRFRRADRHGER